MYVHVEVGTVSHETTSWRYADVHSLGLPIGLWIVSFSSEDNADT